MQYKSAFLAFFLFPLTLHSQNSRFELIAESDKTMFSQVVDLDISEIDNAIQFYAADIFISSVLIGDQKGNKLTFNYRLGREGLGPGEFIEITNIEQLTNGNLLVYDGNLGRISIYNTENRKVDKTIKLDTKRRLNFPREINYNENSDLFYSRSERFFSDNYDPKEERNIIIQSFNMLGELVDDSILVKPSDESYVFQKNGNMSVNPSPIWGTKSLFEVKNDRIYYSWTGKPEIEVYDLKGQLLETIKVKIPRLKFTESDRKSALDLESIMTELKKSVLQNSLFEALPKQNWPWIHDFLIDDQERIWIALPNHFDSKVRTWTIYNKEGKLEEEYKFPLNFTIHQIKKKTVVGELFDFDKFVSTVRVYKLL